jgi:hypothetical protein
MNQPKISEKTIIALIINSEGEGIMAGYGYGGWQDLRRNALYTWLKDGINDNNPGAIHFLEIMVSAVEQLKIDKLI